MTQHSKPQPAADQSELDPNSLAAIRDLIATTDPIEPVPVKERVQAKAAQAEEPQAAPASKRDRLTALSPQAQSQERPKKRAKQPKPQAEGGGEGMVSHLINTAKAKVLGYRPTVKHIVLASAALLILFRPWLVLAIVFLLAFIITGIFLVLGYDGFWRRVMGVARWYARKHPSRSVELHRKLDDFAMKFDAFLDRFPEGSVDGLYLPDFGDLAAADAQHEAALERRFENLRESEA